MLGRRGFLGGSLLVGGAALLAGGAKAQAGVKCQAGLSYSKDDPGRWAGKEGSHAPKVTVSGRKVTIVTPHPMSAAHYIVKHTLLDGAGNLLGEKTFANSDTSAESWYDLPVAFKGPLIATSFCNLHDLWVTEAAV